MDQEPNTKTNQSRRGDAREDASSTREIVRATKDRRCAPKGKDPANRRGRRPAAPEARSDHLVLYKRCLDGLFLIWSGSLKLKA